MAQQVFVISDLHLGGAPGFQMCGAAGQKLLASFVRFVTAQHQPGLAAHLVLAGDAVDFLAEEPSVAFTADENLAETKLNQIFAHFSEVWAAFAAHVAAGAPFTLLIGNHDVELSLPKVRRRLLERLGVGRVELLYDDEALRIGPLLIEHGNRYDDWNWVNHDTLRHVRRELSRGQKAEFFDPQPGSKFVINVMNQIKKDYPWVDLLKPEDSTVPPLLAVLRPDLIGIIKDIGGTAKHWIEMKWRLLGERTGGDSTRDLDIDEATLIAQKLAPTQWRLELAEELAASDQTWLDAQLAPESDERGGTTDFLKLLLRRKDLTQNRAVYLDKLRAALKARVGDKAEAFVLELEKGIYTEPAQRAIGQGQQIKVVVYGHTHHVKRVPLSGGLYLNTGTWADLMRLPTAVVKQDAPTEEAVRELGEFVDDLKDKTRIERWRRQVPTFARIKLGDDLSLGGADVYRFRPDAAIDQMTIPDGPLEF